MGEMEDQTVSRAAPQERGDVLPVSTESDEQLVAILKEYRQILDRGEIPQRAALLAKHSKIADELAACLDNLDFIRNVAPLVNQEVLLEQLGAAQDPRQPAALGDFRIVREIGRGGMGVVYEAEQVSLHRRVALKVLPFAAVLDPRQLQRFKNEALAAAQLKHPHIVGVIAVGCERAVHFYAMEYIEGKTLAEVIDQLRQVPPRAGPDDDRRGMPEIESTAPKTIVDRSETQPLAALSTDRLVKGVEHIRTIAKLGIQVADALNYAHEHGIVHRDVKPSNLMLDTTGKVWVTDFGLAQVESDANLTMTGDVLGTLRYMSPEQALGKRGVVDQRSDVYSLGATLYELLTQQPAIVGQDRRELFQQIADTEPRSLRSLNRDVPGDVETIVLKALSKEPLARYATAGELGDDLQRFLQHQPIRAKRRSLLEGFTKWTRRHPAATVAMLSVMAALCVVSVGLAFHNVRLSNVNNQLRQANSNFDWANTELGKANAGLDAVNSDLKSALAESSRNELHWRRLLYAADMKFADQAFREGDLRQVAERLERNQPQSGKPDNRGVEWHFLKHQIEVDHIDLPGHSGAAHCVCNSPDGRWIATAGENGVVHILDAATFEESRTLRTGAQTVKQVAFSPDGRTVASASHGGMIHIWDLQSHSQPRIIQAHAGDADAVLFTHDGTRLVSSGTEPAIRLWNLQTGEAIGTLEGHTRGCEALAISPDGQILGSASDDGTLKLWDLENKKERLTLNARGRLVTIDFSPDGSLVAAGGVERQVSIWNTTTGERVFFVGHLDRVSSVAFSPDGGWIATADRGGTVRMWRLNPDTGESQTEESFLWTAGAKRIHSVCFTPDGKWLISTDHDGAVTRWNPWAGAFQNKLRTAQLARHVSSDFTFTPDGRFLVTVDQLGGPRLRNPMTGADVLTFASEQRPRSAVAFSPNGKTAAVGDHHGFVQLWDVEHRSLRTEWAGEGFYVGQLAFSSDGATLAVAYGDLSVMLFDGLTGARLSRLPAFRGVHPAFSPDNARLAVANENWIDVWDLATGKKSEPLQGHTTTIQSLAWSPDGHWLASGSKDRNVVLWNMDNGDAQFTLSGHRSSVNSLAFSPDGRSLLSADEGGVLKSWQVATGHPLFDLQQQDAGYSKIAFAPGGRRLGWRLYDGRIGILELIKPDRSWAEIPQRILRGHTDAVEAIGISPDGNVIASGSKNGTIKLWDLASGGLLRTLNGHTSAVQSLVFHPDGKLIASNSHDQTKRLWNVESGAEVRRLSGPGLGPVHFSRDGRLLFTPGLPPESTEGVRICDVRTGWLLKTIDCRQTLGDTLDQSDLFGSAVADIGDLDDDGVPDLAVGARLDDARHVDGNGINQGAVWVLLMKPDGTVRESHKIDAYLHRHGFIQILAGSSSFGSSVASLGDLAGDGSTAIAVGAAGHDHPNLLPRGLPPDRALGLADVNSGAVWVLFLDYDHDARELLVRSPQEIRSGTGGFTGSLGRGDQFGCAVANIGDINGDGVSDLAVGAPRDWENTVDENGNHLGSDRGAVYLLMMNSDGTVREQHQLNDTPGNFAAALSSADQFGVAVTSLGDLDGNGVNDLAIGARGDKDDGDTDPTTDSGRSRGAVWVVFLDYDVQTHVLSILHSQKISADEGGLSKSSIADFDNFGGSLANMGDVDSDGVNDLVVGLYQGDGPAPQKSGAAWLLLMNRDGTVRRQQPINDDFDGNGVHDELESRDHFGVGVASIGDLNGDGVKDLAVGAQHDDDGQENAGAVWVLFLSHEELTSAPAVKSSQKISATAGGTIAAPGGGTMYFQAFSPDDQRFSSCNAAGSVTTIWDVSTGQKVLTVPGACAGRTFSRDGKSVVIANRQHDLRLLDIATGQTIREFKDNRAPVYGAVFSPDGSWLASTCHDGTIRVWDAGTGDLLFSWLGHPEPGAFCPCFTPDGNTLVTCGADRTVRIWDLSGTNFEQAPNQSDATVSLEPEE